MRNHVIYFLYAALKYLRINNLYKCSKQNKTNIQITYNAVVLYHLTVVLSSLI